MFFDGASSWEGEGAGVFFWHPEMNSLSLFHIDYSGTLTIPITYVNMNLLS
jgi:hypothetical protein